MCDKEKILLLDDEILAGMARTGEWLCLQHWDTLPDIVTSQIVRQRFPVTAMIVKEEYS